MISSKHFISENLHQSTQTRHSAQTVKKVIFSAPLFSAIPQHSKTTCIKVYHTAFADLFYLPVPRMGKIKDYGSNPYIAAYNT